MKIKHFSGYGSVNVTKKSKTSFIDEFGVKKTKLVLVVKGNHERGIVLDDIFDAKMWLFDRFEKNFDGDDYDIDMRIQNDYAEEVATGIEVAIYTFIY